MLVVFAIFIFNKSALANDAIISECFSDTLRIVMRLNNMRPDDRSKDGISPIYDKEWDIPVSFYQEVISEAAKTKDKLKTNNLDMRTSDTAFKAIKMISLLDIAQDYAICRINTITIWGAMKLSDEALLDRKLINEFGRASTSEKAMKLLLNEEFKNIRMR